MQTDHNSDGGRRASVSRRNFLQFAGAASAGAAVALPIAAQAASSKAARLSDEEAGLVNLINQHAIISENIDEIESVLTPLKAGQPPYPRVTVREVASREKDYPPEHLEFELDSPGRIENYFRSRMRYFDFEFTRALVTRIESDMNRAARLYDHRLAAFHSYNQETGLLDLGEQEDDLYQVKDRLEEEICALPCYSHRMAILKAKFGCGNLASRIEGYDLRDHDALLMVAMLKSMIPLMEGI